MRFYLVPIILIFPVLAHASEMRQVRCRFLAFGGNGNQTSVLAVTSKGTEIACPLPAHELSKPLVCQTEGNTIRFISPTDRKPLAAATIPERTGAVLLVFIAAADNTSRVFVIADTPENFPDGGAYVANFHHQEARFTIGEHKGMLRPAGAFGYAMPRKLDDFNMAPVMFELRQDDKWRTASESNLRFLPGMRYLIFAYIDPQSGRPRITTIQDIATPNQELPSP